MKLMLTLTIFLMLSFNVFGKEEKASVYSFNSAEELSKYIEETTVSEDANHKKDIVYTIKERFEKNRVANEPASRLRTEEVATSTSSPKWDFGYPTFSSSFKDKYGRQHKYTMVGYSPKSGKTAQIPVKIVPIKITLKKFPELQGDVILDPASTIERIKSSPLFNAASFPDVGGKAQFVDAMQRCSFWNQMDKNRKWSVQLKTPKIAPTLNLVFTPKNATVAKLGNSPSLTLANLNASIFFNIVTLHYFDGLYVSKMFKKNELVIYQCYNCHAGSTGGIHLGLSINSKEMVTFMYAGAWDPDLGQSPKDISILSHELAEWANDPSTENLVPIWRFNSKSDPGAHCSYNPLLETGDPISNCQSCDYKVLYPIKLNGKSYHVQNNVMWQWFSGNKTSNTCNKRWTYPEKDIYQNSARFCGSSSYSLTNIVENVRDWLGFD